MATDAHAKLAVATWKKKEKLSRGKPQSTLAITSFRVYSVFITHTLKHRSTPGGLLKVAIFCIVGLNESSAKIKEVLTCFFKKKMTKDSMTLAILFIIRKAGCAKIILNF